MNEKIPIFFKEKENPDDKSERISLEIEQFVQNNPVEFSEQEEDKLMEEYETLESQGLHGILHVIHQGSGTGAMVKRELPSRFKEKYYHRLHILKAEKRDEQSRFVEPGDAVVIISENGSIDAENQTILENAFRNRVGILSGGGAGNPKKAIAKPLLQVMEREIEKGTPGLGICLGHQLFGELVMNIREKASEGVVGGYFEGPVSVEKVTDQGKQNPIFQRFGNSFSTGSWNEFHLALPEEVAEGKDVFAQGKVLSRSATNNYPTSFSLKGIKENQIMSTQRHPEFRMKGVGQDMIFQDKILNFSDGSELVVPAGSSLDLVSWAQDMVIEPDFTDFNKKYGITADDIRNIFREEILTTNLGKNFYGPMLDYMARFRINS